MKTSDSESTLQRSRERSGLACALLSSVLFGVVPLLTKIAYSAGGTPLSVTGYRFFLSSFLAFLLMKATAPGETLSLSRRQTKELLLASAGYAFTPVFLLSSYRRIPTGVGTTLHFVYPVLIVVLCALLFRDKPNRRQLICLGLCMAGVASFCGPQTASDGVGIFQAVFSGLCFAVYVVAFSKSSLPGMNPYKLLFYLSGFSAVCTLLSGLATQTWGGAIAPLGWGAIAALVFLVNMGATLLFQEGAKRCGPQQAAISSTFEPLTSVLIGIMVFQEPLTLLSVAGILCILSAVILLSR